MNCEHDHQKGKLTINNIEESEVNLNADELYFFNQRIGKIEHLSKAVKCKVVL